MKVYLLRIAGAIVLLCSKRHRRGAVHWARRNLFDEEKWWVSSVTQQWCCPQNNTTGNVVLYDATAKRETVKISNSSAPGAALLHDNSDYQLFVNGKEQICVMQVKSHCDKICWTNLSSVCSRGSKWQAHQCLHIFGEFQCSSYQDFKITFQGTWLYRINLDLYKYGLSRDESVMDSRLLQFILDEDNLPS